LGSQCPSKLFVGYVCISSTVLNCDITSSSSLKPEIARYSRPLFPSPLSPGPQSSAPTICVMTQSFNSLLTVTFLLFATALALPSIPGPLPPTLQLGNPLLATDGGNAPTFVSNTTSPLVLGSSDPSINCDGAKYRTGLRIASCQDAVEQIPRDAGSLRFALRRSGNHDVALPYRFISCECRKRRLLVSCFA